jgi:uncharacterized protein (UPF0548 family)
MKPELSTLDRLIDAQRELAFTYPFVGMTRGPAPPGFVVDRRREAIGRGQRDFELAKAAIRHWEMFHQSWVALYPIDAPIEVGTVVAIDVRIGPTVWLNACRIVYTIDEREPTTRFGFAYGTLPGHAECGEERFMVEMTPDETVWYDLLAYSHPRHWLARLGYPVTRYFQKTFGFGSVTAMRRAIVEASPSK